MFTAMARSSSHRRLATGLLIVLLALGLGWIVYGKMWRPDHRPETIAGLPSGDDERGSADVIRPLQQPARPNSPVESPEIEASPDPANPPDPAALATTTDEPTTSAPETEVAAVPPTTTDSPAVAGSPEAVDTPAAEVVPTFDIVRVERDGSAVIAGRAAPGAAVDVLAGDRVIDQVTANQRGEWVATPAGSIGPNGEELTLLAKTADGAPIESEQVVIIAMPPGAVAPGPDGARGDGAQSTKAPVKLAALDQPVAVLLPKGQGGRSRLLQAPGKIVTDGDLALLMVNYDDQGQIELSGEAPPGASIRVYVDNRPAAMVIADAKGQWTTGLDDPLTPGTYTLRLDQLDPSGQTTARLETPFTRVAERPADRDPQVDYVVVQPGNSLWRIARRLYGSGTVYVHIYDANQTQIKDPDMIYPGQVFEVPADVSSAG